ncbi:MAG: histidine kinase [Lachnospiraceae bacterium]|nr:histidine kinase [Lachnospiraceae bacterium]
MNIIIDKIVLLLFCILGQFFFGPGTASVCAFWACVTVSSLFYALPQTRICRFLSTVYSALIFIVPELALFLPLLSYDYLPKPNQESRNRASHTWVLAPALALAASVFHVLRGSYSRLLSEDLPGYTLILHLAVGCAFSVILQIRTNEHTSLQISYRKMRDDDTELQLLLQERNQSLLEKQNAEIYTATLRERNRIAREIHDNVGHMLTRSILIVGALKTVHKEDGLAEPLEQLHLTLNQAMDDIRKSVHDLQGSTVDLQESLQALIRDFTFCPVTLQYDISSELPRETKYSLISITKEALVNIARHSNATKASITAVEHPGFYQFILRDNGTAADPEKLASRDWLQSSGLGLSNIQNRVQALGGTLSVGYDQGFRIYIILPRNQYQKGITP